MPPSKHGDFKADTEAITAILQNQHKCAMVIELSSKDFLNYLWLTSAGNMTELTALEFADS